MSTYMNTYTINEDARCYHLDIKKLVYVLNIIDFQSHYDVCKLERMNDETGEIVDYYLLFVDNREDDSKDIKSFETDTALRTYLIDSLKWANDFYNK